MAGALLVPVRVIPRARRDEIGGQRGGRLVVRVAAAPEGGAANRAAAAVVAAGLGIRAAEVRLVRGATARDKVLSVPVSAAAALARLMK